VSGAEKVQFSRHGIQKNDLILAERESWIAVGLELCPSRTDKHPQEAFSSWNMILAEALRRAHGSPDQTGPSPEAGEKRAG